MKTCQICGDGLRKPDYFQAICCFGFGYLLGALAVLVL